MMHHSGIIVFMRTTVDLPEPLLKNAKQRAAELNVTLSEVVQDALRSHLARSCASGRSKFQLHTVHGRLVRPDLDLDRISSLIARDDETDYARVKG
jgi:hypothetical protein